MTEKATLFGFLGCLGSKSRKIDQWRSPKRRSNHRIYEQVLCQRSETASIAFLRTRSEPGPFRCENGVWAGSRIWEGLSGVITKKLANGPEHAVGLPSDFRFLVFRSCFRLVGTNDIQNR